MESPMFGEIANLSQRGQRNQVNTFGIAKCALLLLCLSANISLAAGNSSALLSLAPINPEFTGWQSKAATFNLELRDTLGLIPSPIDRSHLLTQTRVLAQLEGLPPSYDLRDYGWVTPVKNQGDCGSCWAFGSYGSFESCLLKNAAETWDFSENHLKNYHGFDWGPCDGGNADMSTAYLARWSGPISEADDPYHDYDDRPSPGGPCRKYLEGVLWFFTASDIKNALMTYGGMYVTMYMSSAYYNSSEHTYYYNGSNSANHAVTLVGWDDNKAVTGAPSSGAWLVKNSWGTGWGNSGYFWISYYDSVAVKYSAAFYDAVSTESYTTNHQYDPLGWTTSAGYGTTTAWAANIFIATANEQLTAVGLYAGADATSYIIYIYDDFNGSTFSDLLGSVSGTLTNSGYHTIPLAPPINLTTGNDFSTVVKFTTPDYNYPIPVEMDFADYSSSATASPGQSYVSPNGAMFTDLTTYDGFENANVCIKGLAIIIPSPPIAEDVNVSTLLDTPVTITLRAIDDGLPNPPGVLSYIITSLPTNGSLIDPGAGGIIAVPCTLTSNGNQVIYTPATDYTGPDNFTFKANDGGTPPDGGDSNIATVSITVNPGRFTIFSEDFESGLGSFTIDNSFGDGSGLWHLTAICNSVLSGHSTPTSLYYGQNSTCNYDAGQTEGIVISPVISLAGASAILLEFNYMLETEQLSEFDIASVEVSENGGDFVEYLSNTAGTLQDSSGGWVPKTLDLSSMAGSNIQIRFRFRTIDDVYNTYPGFYVDDVNVTGAKYTISGHIRNECNVPVEGVLVDANNGGGQDTTDVNGFYEVQVNYNWSGTVTPTKNYYTFDPNWRSYADVLANQTEQNYQAANIYDLDCNGSIGFGDIGIISENWLDGPDLPGDFYKDEDDIVNFLDFAEFAQHWLEGNIP